jgi:PAS domain S-box-containing protein
VHHTPLPFPNNALGNLLSAADLAATPLGARATWPAALATMVQLVLHSKEPMFLVWGEARAVVYNDAYIPVLGNRHPAALFAPFTSIWPELDHETVAVLENAFKGEAQAFRAHPAMLARDGRLQQTWFNFTHTPVYLDDGRIGGVLCILNEITGEVAAQHMLQRQARQLRQLFEDAPGFMALTRGQHHVYELANATYRQLIGMRDPLGKSIREVLPELEGQGFFDLIDQVYTSGVPHLGRRTPVALPRADGALEQRIVDFIFQPVHDADGTVSGIFIQGSDVTDHAAMEDKWKDAAAAAERERDRLNAVLETVPTAIVIADAKGKLVGGNDAMDRLWGANFPRSEAWEEYREWKGWWLDEAGARLRPVEAHEWPMARALRGEDHVREIIGIEPFDRPAMTRIILACGAPIRDREGGVTGAVVAQMDISDQVRVEAALRESETKFRAIANAIPQLVWSNLPDGTHDFYNQRWYDYTGLANGLTDSEGWADVIHVDDQARAIACWRHALATGDLYEVDFRIRHAPTGEFRWCLARAIPVRNAAGEIVRWMGSCTDVHDHREVAEELKRASVRKDEFLAMLAHELRNPLAPLKAATDLLRLRRVDAGRVHELTDVIDRQVRHMTDLVDDLLDVSRVTRGHVELDQHPLDLKTVVANAIEQATPLIEARAHQLHVHMGPAHLQVRGDHTRLVQVLVNLLGNAAKYTQQGGSIDVTVAASPGGTDVRIAVTDNGSGIDAALLPRVFDIFSQGVRTPDRAQGGLGIGLALVKSLVELHGGRVDACSEGAGRGSTFSIVLPLQVRQDAALPVVADGSAAVATARRVMLVDDNVDAADSLGTLLEALGHEVYVKYEPASVVDEARRLRPEVFVLDIGLPGMDGFELARRLRAQPETADALLVALTGYGQAHDRVLSRAAGFDCHFVKPVDIADLERAIAGGPRARTGPALAGAALTD